MARIDTTLLPESAAVQHLAVWQRALAWVTARHQEALVLAAGPEVVATADAPDGWESRETAAGALCDILGLDVVQAGHRIDDALTLTRRLPVIHAMLGRGDVTPAHARAAVQVLAGRAADVIAVVEARVAARAPRQTVAQFRRALQRALLVLDPQTAELAAEAGTRRQAQRYPQPDGSTQVVVDLPAVEAQEVWLALDAVARTLPAYAGLDDTTEGASGYVPIAVRRADALVQLARRALADPGLPTEHRRAVVVDVVVDLPTLLGLADEPAQVLGHGPVPAEVARELAADAGWRRWVTEPVTGHLLDVGTTVYAPPARLRDYLLAAHRTCCFPGCSQPSRRCQLDHVVPFPRAGGSPAPDPDGAPGSNGSTSAANLRPLCGKHHLLKTFHHWEPVVEDDGSLTWTDPAGSTHRVEREPALAR